MKVNKIKIAHIISAVCVVIALALIALLFYAPVFNPGHVYYNDNLLLSGSDNYHNTGTNGATLQANQQN